MGHWVDIEDDPHHLPSEVVVDHIFAHHSPALGLAFAARSLVLGLGLDLELGLGLDLGLGLGLGLVVVIVAHRPPVGRAQLDRTAQKERVQKSSAEQSERKHPRTETQYQADGFEVNPFHPTQQLVEHCKVGRESVVERSPDLQASSSRSMTVCVLPVE